jgi:hypothetical protein
VHLSLLHQELDDVDGALGHAVGEFLNGNDLRKLHLADDLLALLGHAERLLLQPLALAFQRGERTLALLLVERVGDG